MNRKTTLLLAVLFGGAVLASGVCANDNMIGYLGAPVSGTTARVVKIDASTTLIKVKHLEALTIQNRKGQRFAWRFDTVFAPTGFPLKSIAPPDFDAGDTWVYVRPHNSGTTD